VTRSKRPSLSVAEPKTWWQRLPTGEQLPNPVFRRPKCGGTVEDHRNIALDVRELIRKRVFEQPVGSVFRPNIAFPWLRVMRLNSCTLDLELVTGRTTVVPVVALLNRICTLVVSPWGILDKRLSHETRRSRAFPRSAVARSVR
jgi:hypothetical protein